MTLLANRTEILLKAIFQLSKSGNNESEGEDFYDCSTQERRFAIADGVAEYPFSNLWAKSLVTGLVATAPFQFLETEADLIEWLEPMQTAWKKLVDWQNPTANMAETGALSTLLGVQFLDPEPVSLLPETKAADTEMRWQAFAVGNSCLFQIRNNQLRYSFPLTRSDQFGNSPMLLSSIANKNQQIWRHFRYCEEICSLSDLFFLMSGSLAQWFLAECEAGRKPWENLYHLQTQDDFNYLIMSLRNSGQIYDDDVTLLTIQLGKDDIGIAEPMNYLTTEMPSASAMADFAVAESPAQALTASEQRGSTFLIREKGEKEREAPETIDSKANPEAKQAQFQAPQFRSLDQPSVLKQIGKSIIGLLGKKEKEDEE